MLENKETILKVQNLSKTFTSGLLFTKEIYALQDVSFNLQKGEILALVGESGSGKSTTANIMCDKYNTHTLFLS